MTSLTGNKFNEVSVFDKVVFGWLILVFVSKRICIQSEHVTEKTKLSLTRKKMTLLILVPFVWSLVFENWGA